MKWNVVQMTRNWLTQFTVAIAFRWDHIMLEQGCSTHTHSFIHSARITYAMAHRIVSLPCRTTSMLVSPSQSKDAWQGQGLLYNGVSSFNKKRYSITLHGSLGRFSYHFAWLTNSQSKRPLTESCQINYLFLIPLTYVKWELINTFQGNPNNHSQGLPSFIPRYFLWSEVPCCACTLLRKSTPSYCMVELAKLVHWVQ